MARKPLEALEAHFSIVTDPRVERTKHHQLMVVGAPTTVDIIVIAICAILCGAEGWVDVETFGESKQEWLSTFLELPNGIPSHDNFGRVFSRIDAKEFLWPARQGRQKAFFDWVGTVHERLGGEIINIDGKTMRGSQDRRLGKRAIDVVSACLHLVPAQVGYGESIGPRTAQSGRQIQRNHGNSRTAQESWTWRVAL